MALDEGLGEPEPLVIQNYPVAMHVVRWR